MLMSNPFSVEESGCCTRNTRVLCVYAQDFITYVTNVRDLSFHACLAVCW